MDAILGLFILLMHCVGCVITEVSLRYVYIVESNELELPQQIGISIKYSENAKFGVKISDDIILLDRENEGEGFRRLCAAMSSGVSALIDLSWSPWDLAKNLAMTSGVPLLRSKLGSQPLTSALDGYLDFRNATDAALILDSEREVDKSLYELLGESNVRVWVHAGLDRAAVTALKTMRPDPSYYAIIGDTAFVTQAYRRAVKEGLVRRELRWNLVFTDYQSASFDVSQLVLPSVLLSVDSAECCRLMGREECNCPNDFKRQQNLLNSLMLYITESFIKLDGDLIVKVDCENPNQDFNSTKDRLFKQFADDSENNETLFYWDEANNGLYLRSKFILKTYKPESGEQDTAVWSAGSSFKLLPGVKLDYVKMFFRIGTSAAIPWSMPKLDPESGLAMVDDDGLMMYTGYCIDLIQKLSEPLEHSVLDLHCWRRAFQNIYLENLAYTRHAGQMAWRGYDVMNFDYEIITPKVGSFGEKLPNGTWDGVVGDLMRGETDLAIAALTMTAEREEVIDFVAPYFEQTGILIVIRKPTRKTSLFKFMTVLRTEVWLSIVAALLLTGFMIWLLDKYSPYSARNNPEAYPYPCREFTLKESFWFALTSFTPQGGGEAPKALSGRTLVAAYWLFVVLMLATFTANLAAFLTVERMQTPVSSLEQLARQSRINYTVVESSNIHQYFINMKFAEDTLYRVWKEITLNATSDQSQYRVWDYPIREQYGHILLAINASGPVVDAKMGFQQVNVHTDADYAFIHDSAEIRYEVTRNCNLTEVGEVFAEQPYAIAVQQGSRLQEDLSRALLDLQKERFLEQLSAKYWNETARQACPDADESEGITLESLGGVFIATLFGLGLAMLTLAWEVFYYRRKERNKVKTIDIGEKPKPAFVAPKKNLLESKMAEQVNKLRKREKRGKKENRITFGDSFKPVSDTNKVSHISVFPKDGYNP